jgi:hypothetical protein
MQHLSFNIFGVVPPQTLTGQGDEQLSETGLTPVPPQKKQKRISHLDVGL